MGNYEDNKGRRNRSSGRSGGGGGFNNRSGGRGGGYGRDRNFRSRDRGSQEMHDVICDKCKKECQVPFKPSGNKPVLCSDCFKEGGSRNQGNQSGMTTDQFETLNKKLDRIISVLQELEIDEGYNNDGEVGDEVETEPEAENDEKEEEPKEKKKKKKKAKSK